MSRALFYRCVFLLSLIFSHGAGFAQAHTSTVATQAVVSNEKPVDSRILAYVPNEKSGSISIIDTATNTVIDTLITGGAPRGLALSSEGTTLFVSDRESNGLLVISVPQKQVVARIPLGDSPEGVSLSPDGRWVVAAVELSNSVVFINTQSFAIEFSIRTAGKNPEHAEFSPDGRWLLVSAEEADSVDVIDVKARQQVKSITVADRPRGIGFLPHGDLAYVACELPGKVYVINTHTWTVATTIQAGPFANMKLVAIAVARAEALVALAWLVERVEVHDQVELVVRTVRHPGVGVGVVGARLIQNGEGFTVARRLSGGSDDGEAG